MPRIGSRTICRKRRAISTNDLKVSWKVTHGSSLYYFFLDYPHYNGHTIYIFSRAETLQLTGR